MLGFLYQDISMSNQMSFNEVSDIIIHCSDTKNGDDYRAEDIDKWHKERGFFRHPAFICENAPYKHIGYHFVINVSGRVERGRVYAETGAHCIGHNATSIGVCMIGRNKFSLYQFESLAKLIVDIQNYFDKQLGIHGHREFAKKDCPGFDISEWMNSLYLKNHLL